MRAGFFRPESALQSMLARFAMRGALRATVRRYQSTQAVNTLVSTYRCVAEEIFVTSATQAFLMFNRIELKHFSCITNAQLPYKTISYHHSHPQSHPQWHHRRLQYLKNIGRRITPRLYLVDLLKRSLERLMLTVTDFSLRRRLVTEHLQMQQWQWPPQHWPTPPPSILSDCHHLREHWGYRGYVERRDQRSCQYARWRRRGGENGKQRTSNCHLLTPLRSRQLSTAEFIDLLTGKKWRVVWKEQARHTQFLK